jgi:nitrite reductase/ring-hydroxylating ferredoxin subunit
VHARVGPPAEEMVWCHSDADGWIHHRCCREENRRWLHSTVARTDELAPGQGKLVEVRQKRIALFNVGGRYHALDDTCPHRGAPLSEGELEGAAVVCPWHGAILDLATGNVTRPPAVAGIATYDVRLDGEEIAIAV